ncbi:MAG: hypothetical protein ACP5KN_04310 [Armatimonadota bacterium]
MTIRASVPATLVLMLLAPSAARAQPPPDAATAEVQAPTERRREGGEHHGHLFREQHAILSTGEVAYGIAYKACVDPAHGDQVVPLEGYIGMPRPCSCNWYHSGFLFISLNGRDIGTTPLSSMMATETGQRGIVDMVWHDRAADVRARFFALPGADWLGCEVAIDPAGEVASVEVGLRCYPSFFTSWHNRDGARRIQTPSQLIEQGNDVTLPPAESWWGVYYDEIFDVAKGEGEGPCAMLVVPDDASQVRFAPGSYAVNTTITCPADARRVRLAFWDLKGMTNEEALAQVRAEVNEVRATLETADLTPRAVQEFDVAEVRASLQRALANETIREALSDRIDEIQSWLEQQPAEPGGEPGVQDTRGQEQLLQSIDEYNSFKWHVKLLELIHGL